MLHKLRFLQKLGCQKPCWDQARLSSLVNKQVALRYTTCLTLCFRNGLTSNVVNILELAARSWDAKGLL